MKSRFTSSSSGGKAIFERKSKNNSAEVGRVNSLTLKVCDSVYNK